MNKAGINHPPYDPELKATVIKKVRDEGMSAREAEVKYGVRAKTIYTWLKAGVVDSNRNLILENNRLKKELEITQRILGKMTAEVERSKG